LPPNPAPGAWRKVSVPDSLRGKKADEIRKWAREKLSGQEADLSQKDVAAIRDSLVREILLKPKKPGFFLPTGEFVEAIGSLRMSEDLEEADREIEEREADDAFADSENDLFNKEIVDNSEHPMRVHWEHGKRIDEYVTSSGHPLFRIQQRLTKRAQGRSYGLRTHQTAVDLYRWKPHANPDDPVFSWTWHAIDALLKVSKKNDVRSMIAEEIETRWRPAGVGLGAIGDFMRGPSGEAEEATPTDPRLVEYHQKLSKGQRLSPSETEALVQLLKG
jgi:hypothetical protein